MRTETLRWFRRRTDAAHVHIQSATRTRAPSHFIDTCQNARWNVNSSAARALCRRSFQPGRPLVNLGDRNWSIHGHTHWSSTMRIHFDHIFIVSALNPFARPAASTKACRYVHADCIPTHTQYRNVLLCRVGRALGISTGLRHAWPAVVINMLSNIFHTGCGALFVCVCWVCEFEVPSLARYMHNLLSHTYTHKHFNIQHVRAVSA